MEIGEGDACVGLFEGVQIQCRWGPCPLNMNTLLLSGIHNDGTISTIAVSHEGVTCYVRRMFVLSYLRV